MLKYLEVRHLKDDYEGGHEGGAHTNVVSTLIKDTPRASSTLLSCEDTQKGDSYL